MIYLVEEKGYSMAKMNDRGGGGNGMITKRKGHKNLGPYESDIMYYLLIGKVGDNHIYIHNA
jgi:hypothetical protein